MLVNLLFNPLDGGRAAMFNDFDRSNDRFPVKGAFYDDINFTFNLGLRIVEKFRLGYRHARLNATGIRAKLPETRAGYDYRE